MTIFHDFPHPGSKSIERSKALSEVIRNEMDKQFGCLSFATFMEMALYHPQFGFYNAPSFSIGKTGDFTTAPHLTPLFAMCFAEQCIEIFTHLGKGDILELGAGTGRFAADLLLALQQKKCLPHHYYIYEIAPSLRQKQQDFIRLTYPTLFQQITWLEALPDSFTGIIIANEVLDALPVHCFQFDGAQIKERCVRFEKDQFVWHLNTPSSLLAEKAEGLHKLCSFPSPYCSEINLRLGDFIQAIAKSLTRGAILFADYGYGQREYYHPKRDTGTLTAFFQHRMIANPLIYPGLLDITAHINFTALAEYALNAHCQLTGYTTQASFLLASGLLRMAAEIEPTLSPADEFTLHQAIKTLTLPTEMGDCVKVLALSKQLDLSLSGFSLQDRRRDL